MISYDKANLPHPDGQLLRYQIVESWTKESVSKFLFEPYIGNVDYSWERPAIQ
jgi:hypothetical protein